MKRPENHRGRWTIPVIVLAVVVALVGLALAVAGADDADTSARLFTFRDGRLDVDVLNVAAVTFAIGFALSFWRD